MELTVQQALLDLAKKHGKAYLLEALEIVAIPALEAAVAKTEMKLDDMAVAALKEPLKAELKKLIEAI
jgi:vacuolar-type H+-ATPase subunit D/Vma8